MCMHELEGVFYARVYSETSSSKRILVETYIDS